MPVGNRGRPASYHSCESVNKNSKNKKQKRLFVGHKTFKMDLICTVYGPKRTDNKPGQAPIQPKW